MAEAASIQEEEVTIERTTGSVYRALGYSDAAEMERKSRIVSIINETIAARGYTQTRAAEIVGLDQPTLSKLLRGRFRSVSLDKLTEIINALGRDVTIVVGAAVDDERVRGETRVAAVM